ncbi:hypothetical protein [Acuticoccus sediminis]|uniref:hypothetical protein n=1 Tax=Acuticoccus sediminis TaxID=2184697 RepID=UPI001CFE4A6E|nr:hypothetical protein [Acuticoccus sediminis]
MYTALRTAAAVLVIATASTSLPARAADTWNATAETDDTPAAYIRVPGENEWPDLSVHTVDDGQRSTAFPEAPPPPPETIKLVVTCDSAQTLAIHVTGVSYAEPRIIGGLQFDVDGHVMTRIASLEFSDHDKAWFPVTKVTRQDELMERLRKGMTLKASVIGNAADGRVVDVPLAGSHAAINAATAQCDATDAGA